MKLRQILLALFIFALFLSFNGGARETTSAAIQQFQAQEGTGWKFHQSAGGSVRAIYGSGTRRAVSNRDEAKIFFIDHAEMFGIEDPSHLVLERIQTDIASGSSYHFGQYVLGIPVVGGELSVHTDREGRILAASSQYHSTHGLSGASIAHEAEARATAQRLRFADGGVANGKLMILPGFGTAGNPRYVWKFEVASNNHPGQWAVYVDALLPHKILRVHRQFFEAEATGTVFRENAVVTPDQTSERFRYLKNTNTLIGKYVKTYNANFTLPFRRTTPLEQYTTTTETDQDYTYPVTDPRFTEAMAYYHINVVHDRWRSFGFKKLNRQIPVFVNVASPSGGGFDNAFYTRGGQAPFRNGAIVMGAGKIFENFGHDADVYYHEYGHAVLDFAKPRLIEAFESNYPNAFHEGFSDVSSSAITGNSKLAEFALRNRSTGRFAGRELENNNRFPQNVVLRGFGRSESHYTGLIFGGAWWDLQKQIGRDKAQSILYRSLAILPNELTFFDIRNSMIAADRRSNGGANAAAIEAAFAEHGIDGDDPGQKGTISFLGLKTAKLNLSNFNIRLKSNFKRGDAIIVVANYSGKGLTPGYNLIPEFEISGPANGNVSAFPFIDEATNGSHSGKRGAWVAEIQTFDTSALGDYTVTIRFRLGGSSLTTAAKSFTFKIVE